MDYSSKSLEDLVVAFSKLPGIGLKSAQRMALHLLEADREESEHLAQTILALKDNVKSCSVCFNLTEEDVCSICSSSRRDSRIICVVEEPKDLMAIEKTGGYKGLYHVLGGTISPLDGVEAGDLTLQQLLKRLDGTVTEVIIATNPTVEGEMTAAHLHDVLQGNVNRITRIARGIPFGGALEFNDMVTVAKALEGRSDF